MPLYEYSCGQCKHIYERLLRSHTDPAPPCPKCGHPTPEKLLSAPSFHLKGGGWADTGYSKK